jgi:hypothetical protein
MRPWATLLAAGLLGAAAPNESADRIVRMATPPPLRRNVAAMPLIAQPSSDAERRINAALRKLDARVLHAAAACKDAAGHAGLWVRSAETTMAGPLFLSFVITDSIDCGGAHPDSAVMSIVYDLRTGQPVDWTALLPPAMTGDVALEQGEDGSKMVTLSSRRLWGLYWMAYQAAHVGDDSCLAAIKEIGVPASGGPPPGMMVWLSAKSGGLGLTFNVPHAVLACADEMVVPTATLHHEGAKLALVEALEAAHAQ